MIVLRKMWKDEFPAYCKYFIHDYSQEIVQNYGHSADTAVELARKDLEQSFPDGIESSDDSLLSIDAEIDGRQMLVGYLWYSINTDDKSAFICDFYVFEEYRNKGIGKQAVKVLETQLISAGINQLKLRVAYDNKRALKLYEDIGFSMTGINMSKQL